MQGHILYFATTLSISSSLYQLYGSKKRNKKDIYEIHLKLTKINLYIYIYKYIYIPLGYKQGKVDHLNPCHV